MYTLAADREHGGETGGEGTLHQKRVHPRFLCTGITIYHL